MARENTNHKALILDWFGVDDFKYDLRWVKEVQYLRKVTRFIPFLKQIGVCNSVAMGVAGEKSDIDLFVVTEAKRVYLVRFWMVFVIHLLGKRRYGDKVNGRFCLSFFVDEYHIDMSDLMIEDDYYFEYWKRNVWWLLKDEEFLSVWRKKNGLEVTQRLFTWEYKSFSLFARFWDVLNFGLGVLQRLKAHKTYKRKNFPKGVVFEEGIVKCHDQDIRWKFREFIETSLK